MTNLEYYRVRSRLENRKKSGKLNLVRENREMAEKIKNFVQNQGNSGLGGSDSASGV
jgi:hypothetical protein